MIKPWMLLAAMLLVGGTLFAVAVHRKWNEERPSDQPRERFRAESADSDDEIVAVADAYMKQRGSGPSTSEVRRAIKAMRRDGEPAADVVERQLRQGDPATPPRREPREPDEPDARPEEAAEPPPPRRPQPAADALDNSMLRRVEDELESMVNRIDGLLEEIQALRGRQISGPLTEDSVETFVPYHPV